ncbi:response regulator [Fusibacter sp. JL298sf-3]
MVKVLIADDQALLRKSLGQIISIDDDIQVVAMASTGVEAVEKCSKICPDIVMMDIEMPKMNGIDAMRIIKEKYPKIKVIVLTTFDNRENIVASFTANADGYITKDIGPEELILTLKCVLNGLTVIHQSVKEIMLEKFERAAQQNMRCVAHLTSEEVEMIRLIVSGYSNKAIGERLNYTEGTIKNKISKMYGKLGVSDRVQLAIFAIENGIEQ